jgi:hypothetical protein
MSTISSLSHQQSDGQKRDISFVHITSTLDAARTVRLSQMSETMVRTIGTAYCKPLRDKPLQYFVATPDDLPQMKAHVEMLGGVWSTERATPPTEPKPSEEKR